MSVRPTPTQCNPVHGMKQIYIDEIAARAGVKAWQVENCVQMFEAGDTVPFISRYRKEKTGGLDDVSVAELKHWVGVFGELEKRKASILATIESQGKLEDGLRANIEACVNAGELEDLYLPYRPKRRTRASIAREAGLEPLADAMFTGKAARPETEAARYVGDSIPTVEEALAGARDIIAERMSETASVRETLRGIFRGRRLVSKEARGAGASPNAAKYRSYFAFSYPVARIPAHNLLAILRAENEGILSVSIDADAEKCCNKLYYDHCQAHGYPGAELARQIRLAVDDAYKRLLEPSITNDIVREAKRKADAESTEVFGENLRQLLLSPPAGARRTLAIDPGFRNGCKTVCLDERGNLLHHEIIFPHPPQNEKVKSIMRVQEMLVKYGIEAIAIGNGTASRETEDFIRKVALPEGCKVWTVSEDGASIYSASEAARKEFPDEDVTVRGAVSIGRRLMDPLAELVKIDPRNLGIGQYQHDVDQSLLKEKLDSVVESCVNAVGVNLNTASAWLLAYVAGIGPSLAEKIIAYRDAHGSFTSRAALKKVPRLGDKTFEQCAGFIRIPESSDPLDNSAVHPETYHIVDRMAHDLGVDTAALIGNASLCDSIDAGKYVDGDFGLPTINDIIREIAKPGRDPREEADTFEFAQDIRDIEDLKEGMELPGIVTNITQFGAFVDIGLHENGLIHASQMGVKGHAEPSRVLKLHQHVSVMVISVDGERRRIGLRLVRKDGHGQGGNPNPAK